jgi:hypothetical protein
MFKNSGSGLHAYGHRERWSRDTRACQIYNQRCLYSIPPLQYRSPHYYPSLYFSSPYIGSRWCYYCINYLVCMVMISHIFKVASCTNLCYYVPVQ